MKMWRRPRLLALAVLCCFFGMHMMICAMATTTGQQIENVENEKEKAEENLDKTNESLDELNSDRASLQVYLKNVSAELERANEKLAEIERIRKEKETAIAEAGQQIEEARRQQEIRYEEMQQRIKFMYEMGNQSYLELFLTADSFADFLNKADYIEMINRYDRQMLDKYIQTERLIAEKEQDLLKEKETLLVLEQEAGESSSQMHETVKETGENLKKYADEIAEKEAQALAYEQEIAEAENDLVALREKYKEELAMSAQSQAMGSRDLSEIVFESGDEDLMAAIIECEAGGESYTGKVAVGAVVMNRVRSPLFPNTVLEVIMAPKQFSPVGSGRFAIVLSRGANESCYQAARDAMAGASPVGDCLFFRTPIPGLTGQQIGGHIFY